MPNYLKDFPTDVKKAVLIKQAEINSSPKMLKKHSQRHTIIQIVKEWLELKPKQAS